MVSWPDGNEFVIERLYKGSVINFRSFMIADNSLVDYRCSKKTNVFIMTSDQL